MNTVVSVIDLSSGKVLVVLKALRNHKYAPHVLCGHAQVCAPEMMEHKALSSTSELFLTAAKLS